jgi:hypothetical protein
MQEFAPLQRAASRCTRKSTNARRSSSTRNIASIEFVGPVTALAKVECSIRPKHFTDLLSLIHLDGRWQIIAKVFHYEIEASVEDAPSSACGRSFRGEDE